MQVPGQQQNTAILIFANSAQQELRQKSIPKSERFFNALTDRTLATVATTELPYFHFTEEQQKGNSFGERFTNAIQSVFDKGFEQIITIGNDTPHLKASHIQNALVHLQDGKTVLGPSADGGFYLMGLHRSNFNASEFKKLAWQTASLLQEVSILLGVENRQPIRLQTLFDVDTVDDLKSLISRFKNIPKKLFATILSLLTSAPKIFRSLFLSFDNYTSNTYYNKGSPFVLHA